MASAISASLTSTMRAAPARMAAKGSGMGTRQAMPSAKVSAVSVSTTRPALKLLATAGALAATTPMISVFRRSRSLVVMRPQTPEPMPMGT